ncbi:MAG: hypothetical protein AAF502_02355 [Bacteroidota bacterium]
MSRTASDIIITVLLSWFCLQISAQPTVDVNPQVKSAITLEQEAIHKWLQNHVKNTLLDKLWQGSKSFKELSVKNWRMHPETKKYQLQVVVLWKDDRSNATMAIEGKIEFSYPINGDAVFKTVGKTRNIIELEQTQQIKVPGTLALEKQ